MTMFSVRKCKRCEAEYIPAKKLKGGFIHHCDRCSRDGTQKYLGRVTGNDKGGEITIYRTNLKFFRQQLRRESKAGFAPCLPVSSYSFAQDIASQDPLNDFNILTDEIDRHRRKHRKK